MMAVQLANLSRNSARMVSVHMTYHKFFLVGAPQKKKAEINGFALIRRNILMTDSAFRCRSGASFLLTYQN